MQIKQKLTEKRFKKGTAGRKIEYIVIHYFGTPATAEEMAKSFLSSGTCSAHYVLDEGETVWQCVKDEDIAWHCGTKKGYFHPKCRNKNSIGIEVRPQKTDASTVKSAEARDWYFTPETEENLLALTRLLMKKHGIGAENVLRHYDVTHKLCPRPYVGEDENTHYGTSGDEQWARFKRRLTEEETDEEEETEMKRYQTLTDIPEAWGWRESVKKLMDAGILQGDGNGVIDLSEDMVRGIVLSYRGGAYDRALKKAGLDPAVSE